MQNGKHKYRRISLYCSSAKKQYRCVLLPRVRNAKKQKRDTPNYAYDVYLDSFPNYEKILKTWRDLRYEPSEVEMFPYRVEVETNTAVKQKMTKKTER